MFKTYKHDRIMAGMYTHHTKISDKLANKYNMVYSPYIALSSAYDEEE